MMLDWTEYQKQLGKRTAEIARTNPDIIRSYRGLSDAGLKTDLLGAKREN